MLKLIVFIKILIFLLLPFNIFSDDNENSIIVDENTNILQNDNYEIYFNKNDQNIFLGNGTLLSISPNRKFVIWIFDENLKNIFNSNLSGLYLFDIDNLLKTKLTSEVYYGYGASWSPDGNFIVLDEGTGPGRTKKIFDTYNKNLVLEIETIGNFTWISNCDFIYNVYEEEIKTLLFPPSSIVYGNIHGEIKKIL